ncbi:MAG: 4-alpha-glucanotransferase [Porticoccaceae bacterium]
MDSTERLLYLSGIAADYLGYAGEHRVFSRHERLRVLAAMGIDGEDAASVERALFEFDSAPWLTWLRPLCIAQESDPAVPMHFAPAQLESLFQWTLTLESGETRSGTLRPVDLPESGEYYSGGVRYSGRRLHLDAMPLGYHHFSLVQGSFEESCVVVLCPERCHDAVPEGAAKIWGISCQLYTLRSARNWGIGDFSDLEELIRLAAAMGADMVGLNPLHAPCSRGFDGFSPYSPSDRRFLDPIYIDPLVVEDLALAPRLAARIAANGFQAKLQALRDLTLVDHAAVTACKYPILESLYAIFRERATAPRRAAFAAFVAEEGDALRQFAAYEVAHNSHAKTFCNEPEFYQYLQWLAASQLERCQRVARDCGMHIGLMRDLAVGAVDGGSEVHTNPGLYVKNVTIGAPPDPFAAEGQDWGLPVMSPLGMRRDNFCHYIRLLRANMRWCGALRIDHVMALVRLWWCLRAHDDEPRLGIYVYYPFDEMLALLRLESVRNDCLIIGEDLGVVPELLRHAMVEHALYGNRVLYFEQYHDHRFKPPEDFQGDVLLMVTNHDVATLADWWRGGDVRRRHSFGLSSVDHALEDALAERERDKRQLLVWLDNAGLLPQGWRTDDTAQVFDEALCSAVHRACARSRSGLLLLQLEDLQLLAEPVNVPGTFREYPNWRRKQEQETTAIFATPWVRALLEQVNEERRS